MWQVAIMTRRFKFISIGQIGIALALWLGFFAGPAVARPVKILALGSSLTQGYGLPPGTEFTTQLQAALKAQGIDTDIINAGVSGDTTLMHQAYETTWMNEWRDLQTDRNGINLTSSVDAVSWGPQRVDIFGRNGTGNLWHAFYSMP